MVSNNLLLSYAEILTPTVGSEFQKDHHAPFKWEVVKKLKILQIKTVRLQSFSVFSLDGATETLVRSCNWWSMLISIRTIETPGDLFNLERF